VVIGTLREWRYDRTVRELGPADATLTVKTFREGVAAVAGHDLVIEVTRWSARIGDDGAVELSADPGSLEVRQGLHGAKPLSDRDRREIRKNIEQKVLGTHPIEYRGAADGSGELTMAGTTRPLRVERTPGGGRATVTQSEWGIKPYRGLMGALKVRDDVEVTVTGL
jgi:hypothetical protein